MPPLPSSKETSEGPPLQWQPVIWYFLFTLGMLWFWQEAAPRAALRTIPYIQFKDDLKRGEVVECVVKQAEISGKIQPKPATSTETSQGTSTKKPAPGSIPAPKKLEEDFFCNQIESTRKQDDCSGQVASGLYSARNS
jgi:hypothetical protein